MTLWCCEMLDISESYTIFLIVTYVVRATFQMRFLIPDLSGYSSRKVFIPTKTI